MTETNAPLRERKRRATQAAIEDNATRLVLERGYHDVTVEDICAAAGISKRTFFNYVDSKEAAVLGTPPSLPAIAEIDALLAQVPSRLTEALLDVFFDTVFRDTFPERSAMSAELIRRHKLIRRNNPELRGNRLPANDERAEAIEAALVTYLEQQPQARRLNIASTVEATSVVYTVLAALQLGLHLWVQTASTSLSDLRTSCHNALGYLPLLAA